MPAKSTYTSINGVPVSKDKIPAVQFDIGGHRKTDSHGSSKAAKDYRERLAETIKTGKKVYQQAIAMEIMDMKSKSGRKYNGAFRQTLAWLKCKKYI